MSDDEVHYAMFWNTIKPSVFKLPCDNIGRLECQGSLDRIIFYPQIVPVYCQAHYIDKITPHGIWNTSTDIDNACLYMLALVEGPWTPIAVP